MAGAGTGLGALIIFSAGIAILKTYNKIDNKNLDFSRLMDTTNLLSLLASFALFLIVTGIILGLWHVIGIVRVLAAAYLIELGIVTGLTILMAAHTNEMLPNSLERNRRATAHESAMERRMENMKRDFQDGRPGFSSSREVSTTPTFSRPSDAPLSRDPSSLSERSRFGPLQSERPSAVPSQDTAMNDGAVGIPPRTADLSGFRPVTPNQVRVIFLHRSNTDFPAIRERFVQKMGNPRWRARRGTTQSSFVLEGFNDLQQFAD